MSTPAAPGPVVALLTGDPPPSIVDAAAAVVTADGPGAADVAAALAAVPSPTPAARTALETTRHVAGRAAWLARPDHDDTYRAARIAGEPSAKVLAAVAAQTGSGDLLRLLAAGPVTVKAAVFANDAVPDDVAVDLFAALVDGTHGDRYIGRAAVLLETRPHLTAAAARRTTSLRGAALVAGRGGDLDRGSVVAVADVVAGELARLDERIGDQPVREWTDDHTLIITGHLCVVDLVHAPAWDPAVTAGLGRVWRQLWHGTGTVSRVVHGVHRSRSAVPEEAARLQLLAAWADGDDAVAELHTERVAAHDAAVAAAGGTDVAAVVAAVEHPDATVARIAVTNPALPLTDLARSTVLHRSPELAKLARRVAVDRFAADPEAAATIVWTSTWLPGDTSVLVDAAAVDGFVTASAAVLDRDGVRLRIRPAQLADVLGRIPADVADRVAVHLPTAFLAEHGTDGRVSRIVAAMQRHAADRLGDDPEAWTALWSLAGTLDGSFARVVACAAAVCAD